MELMRGHEAMMAVSNYVDIMRFLHPMDPGPQALFKVVLEKYWSENASADRIRRYFATVCDENAGRACRDEAPLSFNDCKVHWNNTEEVTRDKEKNPSKPRERSSGPTDRKRKKLPFCGKFNTAEGCPFKKTPMEDGCINPNGYKYKHG